MRPDERQERMREERKRLEDLEFLARLRACDTIKKCEHLLRDHKRAPQWKRAAIHRRLKLLIVK